MTARCAASSSASGTIGGAGRSSAGRLRHGNAPWKSFPNTIPGARKGWRFWRRAVPGSGRTARPRAISKPCRERAPAWKRPSRCSSARGSSTMPNASNEHGTRFAKGPWRSASRSCMLRATGWWRSWAKGSRPPRGSMRMYGARWRNGGRSKRRRRRWQKRCAPCPTASRRGGNAGRTCRRTSPAGSIRNIPLAAPGARKAVHWRP